MSGRGEDAWPPPDDPGDLDRRLRSLRWPKAAPAARRRCWKVIAPALAERAPDAEPEGTQARSWSAGTSHGSGSGSPPAAA